MPSLVRTAFALLGVTAIAFCLTACNIPLVPVLEGPIETVPSYYGTPQVSLFNEFSDTTMYERNYRADKANGYFRGAVHKKFPVDDPASHKIWIREFWWRRGPTVSSFLLAKQHGQWLVFEAFRWNGHTQFPNQAEFFGTR